MALRSEQEIFDDLSRLCTNPGYTHAIAFFCFRDQVVHYKDAVKSADYLKLFSFERLIRTEISTLIGLMIRAPRDLALPELPTLESYINQTESLLKELHDALNEPMKAMLKTELSTTERSERNPFADGAALREPIFYGSESAYSFQYRDLAVDRYVRDRAWLEEKKGFAPTDARTVILALNKLLNERLIAALDHMEGSPQENWSVLTGFQFVVADVVVLSELPTDTVAAVLDAFTFPENSNPTFTSLNEFNAANAFPIFRGEGEHLIMFLYVSLTESLYESPFYWMISDKEYSSFAAANRGRFTEDFAVARLQSVFGVDRVYRNVDVWETSARKKKLGEIDVLEVVGDHAIVVQAKSKKLTVASRKGNDLQLKSDFKAAVQDACDQAIKCCNYLLEGSAFLTHGSGTIVELQHSIRTLYPVCVVSDHYPALSFQAQQLLSFEEHECIKQPLVCDVFFVDTVTEFLKTPLRFLSYLELRARAAGNLGLSHENIALAFHLRRNLWLGEYDFIALGDDIAVDLDIAMAARRDGIPGEKNLVGILTELQGTAVGRIVEQIEKRSEPGAIRTGLELLKLSGKSALDLSKMIESIVALTAHDGKLHDATIASSQAGIGITVHCSLLPVATAYSKLNRHCELRKYSIKAATWYGLAIAPDISVLFGLMLDYPWKEDAALETTMARMPPTQPMQAVHKLLNRARRRKKGRNERCHCGSGLKYKKCHLLNDGND